MLCSFIFGNSYLSSKIGVTQAGGNNLEETIVENGLVENVLTDSFFKQPAYAYTENLTVDGSILSLEGNEALSPSVEDYFVIVDNNNLMGINAPLSFYLPTAKRHGIIKYIVQDGDTAGKIASNFGVSLNTILWANNLKSGAIIKPGQELIILPVSGIRHIVQKGDTVSSIAKKYQAVTDEIIAFNNITNNEISVGQELIIPNGQLSSATSLAVSAGLKPMTIDISSWPNDTGFFAYPTSGGWNKGILHYYNAIDIINSCGSPIYASADGIVIEAKTGWNLGYGNYVKIQHFNGTLTVYGHLGGIYVKSGDRVNQNQAIGTMSDTGNANGCHLHFEVRGAQNPFVLKK
ncbi:MAG: peptidoglycan DD-metalloendopeptidase family protein [Parcubacteria group bacterium]|nr:peptidoglycan DD-metalloendopeptidase family protein [Parcubacteria group bacterium]